MPHQTFRELLSSGSEQHTTVPPKVVQEAPHGAQGAVHPVTDPNLILALREHTAALRETLDAIPRSIEFHGTGVFPSSGNLLITPKPGGPSEGRIWHVKSFRVVRGAPAADQGSSAKCYVFVGMQPPTATVGDLAESYRDNTTTNLPLTAFYTSYQMPIKAPARLYFVITGGTAADVFQITGAVQDEPDTIRGAREVYEV